jgi:hypothetical protein
MKRPRSHEADESAASASDWSGSGRCRHWRSSRPRRPVSERRRQRATRPAPAPEGLGTAAEEARADHHWADLAEHPGIALARPREHRQRTPWRNCRELDARGRERRSLHGLRGRLLDRPAGPAQEGKDRAAGFGTQLRRLGLADPVLRRTCRRCGSRPADQLPLASHRATWAGSRVVGRRHEAEVAEPSRMIGDQPRRMRDRRIACSASNRSARPRSPRGRGHELGNSLRALRLTAPARKLLSHQIRLVRNSGATPCSRAAVSISRHSASSIDSVAGSAAAMPQVARRTQSASRARMLRRTEVRHRLPASTQLHLPTFH